MEQNTSKNRNLLNNLESHAVTLSLIAPKLVLLVTEQQDEFFDIPDSPENKWRILCNLKQANIRHQILVDYVLEIAELSEGLDDTFKALCAEKRESNTPEPEQADSEQTDPGEYADGPVAKIKELLHSLPPEKKLDFRNYVRYLADTPSEAEAVQ